MNVATNSAPCQRPFPFVRVIAVAMLVNLFLPLIPKENSPAALVVLSGVVFSEMALLSAWAVLGPQQIWSQWFASLLTLISLWTAMMAPSAMAGAVPESALWLQGIFALPLVFVIAQAPLWGLRLLFG